MNDIIDKLMSLNDRELAKVVKLINKLAAKHKDTSPETPVENVESIPEPPADIFKIKKEALQSAAPVKKVGGSLRQELVGDEKPRLGKGSKKNKNTDKKRALPEPYKPPEGPNKFFELVVEGKQVATAAKEDTNIDRKLWEGKRPTPRIRRSSLVEVECVRCGDTYEIDPSLISSEEGYVCNDCVVSNRRG